MVKPFQFARLPMIYFGSGKISELPGIVSYFGKSVLLVTGARSFMDSRRAGRLFDLFGSSGIAFQHVPVRSEPSPETVDETVLKLRGSEPDAVVSIGGGSVIDAGKAISAMLGKTGSVTEYLEVVGNKEHPGTKVPFIAVPTTSGTGSEATKNAVISQVGKDGFKRSLRHDNFVPDAAIVDPELTLKCPPEITAAAGMDCFTQLTEAYLSTKSNEYTDVLALEGLAAIRRSIIKSFTDGDSINARSDMSFAALTSGICLANAGLGAVHGLAGTIGALFDIPHGVVCGTLMSDANEINIRELRKSKNGETALRKYATLGRLFSDTAVKSDNYYIDFFLDYLRAVTFFLDLPKLSRFGLSGEDLPGICSQTEVKNNPVSLSAEQLEEIIIRRL
ncbi:MAG: iron-containing alcohol dehydrogenase [Bacteroidales bacterium]|jgi:alcohol dehydrogenase class IV|nr:iron-containing alcohol dehydrogenase [Bacteroidales bacterium]